MAAKFNVQCVFDKLQYKGKFKDSLLKLLARLSVELKLTDIRSVAYFLATAAVESSYCLTRWEADYVCNSIGEPMYPPCEAALKYYRSTEGGKKDYYTLGVDKNGIPYYGRGLFQLTGKGNYKLYGDLIGVDLVSNPELALTENNSYKIAIEYFKRRTEKFVLNNDLVGARRSVNGGLKDINKVNAEYTKILKILKDCSDEKMLTKENENEIKKIVSTIKLDETDKNNFNTALNSNQKFDRSINIDSIGTDYSFSDSKTSAADNDMITQQVSQRNKDLEQVFLAISSGILTNEQAADLLASDTITSTKDDMGEAEKGEGGKKWVYPKT